MIVLVAQSSRMIHGIQVRWGRDGRGLLKIKVKKKTNFKKILTNLPVKWSSDRRTFADLMGDFDYGFRVDGTRLRFADQFQFSICLKLEQNNIFERNLQKKTVLKKRMISLLEKF